MDTKPTNTLINLFETAVKNFPNNTFLMEKVGEQWQNTTFSQMQSLVYNFGSGLVKLGITPKDNIALLSEGRNNWPRALPKWLPFHLLLA